MKMTLNGKDCEIADIEVDAVDTRDYPDFCDAFICSASILEDGTWREATEAECEKIGDKFPDVVNEIALEDAI